MAMTVVNRIVLAGLMVAAAIAQPKPPENYLLAGCAQSNSKTLNCEALQISNVPLDIPAAIEKLLLKNNIINDNSGTVLKRCTNNNDPCGSGELKAANLENLPSTVLEIQLQGNGIISIEDNAFAAVGGNLNVLRLFANELTEIKANGLAGLNSLTTLYINNNGGLEAIRSGAFNAFSSTLSELFAKDNDKLKIIEDNSVNALTFRPIFIDMTTDSGSLCAISPPKIDDEGNTIDGTITCACAENSGLYGGDQGFCILSSPPSVSPTVPPTTSEPTTAAPTTAAPTTAAPTTAAPTTAAPTTSAETTAASETTAEEQNREDEGDEEEDKLFQDAGKKGKKGDKGKKGKSQKENFREGEGEDGHDAENREDEEEEEEEEEDPSNKVADQYTKGMGMGMGKKAAKMSLDDSVSYLPVGDLYQNVDLNGAQKGKWMVLGVSGAVVLAVGIMAYAYRQFTTIPVYKQLPFDSSTPEREPLKDIQTHDYEACAPEFSAELE